MTEDEKATSTAVDLLGAMEGAETRKAKPRSRPQRWADACSSALAALEALREVKEEYEEWRDNLPESLQSSPVGEKLEAICDLDLDAAVECIEEAESMDLPRGFGKD